MCLMQLQLQGHGDKLRMTLRGCPCSWGMYAWKCTPYYKNLDNYLSNEGYLNFLTIFRHPNLQLKISSQKSPRRLCYEFQTFFSSQLQPRHLQNALAPPFLKLFLDIPFPVGRWMPDPCMVWLTTSTKPSSARNCLPTPPRGTCIAANIFFLNITFFKSAFGKRSIFYI